MSSILSKLDPTKILADAIKKGMQDRAELKQMIQDAKPAIQKAYAEAYVLRKIEQAQKKAETDALPFNEKMKIRMAKMNERMERDRLFFAGTGNGVASQ